VPHYWDHVLRVWDESDLDTSIKKAEAIHLDGVVELGTNLQTRRRHTKTLPINKPLNSGNTIVHSESPRSSAGRPRVARTASRWRCPRRPRA
jgi:hypothetical protein